MKKNNFDEKSTKDVNPISDKSLLRYRKPLNPLEQSDEFASQDRWGSTSKTAGVGTSQYILGSQIYVFERDVFPRDGFAGLKIDASGLIFTTVNGVGAGTITSGGTNSIDINVGGTDTFTFNDGGLLPPFLGTDFDLGGTFNQWRNIYLINAPIVSSDRRRKNDIADIKYGLDTVMQMRPVSFTREHFDQTHLGFIAQEVKELVPEVIRGTEEGGYSMVYEELIPVLVGSIKDLKTEIDTLRKELRNKV